MSDERSNGRKSRRDAARALQVGAVLAFVGVLLVLSPFVWGARFTWNKYFVVSGLLLTLAGASILFNGGLDWLRSKP
ncbi:hypothetical protein BH09PLA1_BH09PLA1_26720 [soil metagenome]